MTWREEDMYPYVRTNLRARYPAHGGWEFCDKEWAGYKPDFVIQKRRGRKIERVVVEVKATCKVLQSDIGQLNRYARNLSGSKSRIVNKTLVVPSRADTSVVPSDVEIMYFKHFKCEKGDIVWYE